MGNVQKLWTEESQNDLQMCIKCFTCLFRLVCEKRTMIFLYGQLKMLRSLLTFTRVLPNMHFSTSYTTPQQVLF